MVAIQSGAVHLLLGREPIPDKTEIICHPDFSFWGLHSNSFLGHGVAAIGDLNGDLCSESAFGASKEAHLKTTEGAVYILFGWGENCAYSTPHLSRLSPKVQSGEVGYSMVGGHDVDGDGIPDLVVGSLAKDINKLNPGALWLVSGAYLSLLTPVALGEEGDLSALPIEALIDPQSAGLSMLAGPESGVKFAQRIGLVPNLFSGGRAGVVVGAPLSAASGTALAGAAYVYEFQADPYGWNTVPFATIMGETYRTPGFIGNWVAGGTLNGQSVVIVGGKYGTPRETLIADPEGVVTSIDQGSVYEMSFDSQN
jgi:hypothetical protein